MKKHDFIVIGGGLSGLAAQHQLVKKGYDVLLIESSNRVGGRTRTEDLNGSKADVGTQFFHQDYLRIVRLLKELNLEFTVTGPILEFRHKEGAFLLNSKNPFSGWLSGMVSFTEQIRFIRGALKFSGTPSEDLTDALLYDGVNAREMAVKLLGESVTDKLIEPYFSAFTYAHGKELSAAMLVRALKYMATRKHPIGLKDGLAALPKALAEGKQVLLGAEVTKIDGTTVTTSQGTFSADKIIVATTATVAQRLLNSIFPGELATTYSPSLHHAVLTDLKGQVDPACYATMVGESANPYFNVVTREQFKAKGLVKENHELYGLLASKEGAIRNSPIDYGLLKIDEREVKEKVTTVWKEAIPVLGPGQLTKIMNYRKRLKPTDTYFLAGDYLGTHCAEGAVESGEFIASIFPSK